MNGVIIINKPVGVSSNYAVVAVKKAFNTKKVGHLGTLDPLASGVLPICVGKATKLFDYYLKKTKTYMAKFTFGKTTDTLDSEGQVIETNEHIPTKEEILNVLSSFTGEIDQLPPKYSAKSVGGVRAYELSRKGIDFDLPTKKVTVYKFELKKQITVDTFEFLIDCSSGTYIRSLARDLGLKCNTCAYMSGLVRTRSGEWTIDEAVDLEHIACDKLIPLDKVLDSHKKVIVPDEFFDKLKNGNAIKFSMPNESDFLLLCKGELFGIADSIDGKIKVRINLYGG